MGILKNEKIESVITLVDDFSKHLYSVCDVFFKVISWTFSLSLLGWIARMPHDLYEKAAFIIILISGILLVGGFLFIQTTRLLRYPLRKIHDKTGWFGSILFIVFILTPSYISMHVIFYFVPNLVKHLMTYQHPALTSNG